MSTAIAEQLIKPNLQAIRQRIASGEYASRIAEELGVSPQILSYHLRQSNDWKETLASSHETRLDSEQAELDNAIAERDFDLARAREGKLKRLEWRAERECPERWGAKQEVTHRNAPPSLVINVVGAQQVVASSGPNELDITPVAELPSPDAHKP